MAALKLHLRRMLEDIDCKAGRVFAWLIQGLIVISLVSLSLQTLPDISAETKHGLRIVNLVCMVLFTIEYILRLFASERKLKFAFSFYGVIDFLAVVPYYLSLGGVESSALRAFRFLRLFQLFKFARYIKALRRYYIAFMIAKEELLFFLLTSLIILYLAAIGIYQFENAAQPEAFSSVFHSLWWAVATLTTVGYGDIYPITVGGRVFTFFILFVGLGLVSVPAGMVASALAEARRIEAEEVASAVDERGQW